MRADFPRCLNSRWDLPITVRARAIGTGYGSLWRRCMSLKNRSEHGLAASDPNNTTGVSRTDVPLIALAGVAAVILVWVVQMPSSLWIDELGTFWVIDGDLPSTARRAWRFHGQTPLYYTMLWAVTQVLGASEIVLRLPSLLSMLAAALLLYRFTGRLFDRSAAIVALTVFVVYPNVGVHAGDARPYALALLATLIATMLLESWLRTQQSKRAAWYGLAAAAIVYVHYVFASILAAHALFFAWILYRSQPAQRRRLWIGGVWAAAIFLLAIAPTFPQVMDLLGRSDELVLTRVASLSSIVESWAPPIAAVALIGVVALVAGRGGRLRQLKADPLILLGLGFVTPPLVLFMLAQMSEIIVWAPRYWFAAVPFGAMLFGVLVTSGLRNARSVKITTLTVLLVGILTGTSVQHSIEDWRSAMSAANSITDPDTTVLMFSSLIELKAPEFLIDPEKKSYVTSPLAYYPIEGNVAPLPWTSVADQTERLTSALAGVAAQEPVVVITNQGAGSPLSFVSGWFSANGYETTTAMGFGSIRVVAFAPP